MSGELAENAPARVLIKGNEAVAFGAVDAGCRCYFGLSDHAAERNPRGSFVAVAGKRRAVRAGRERGGRFKHVVGRGGQRHSGHDLFLGLRHLTDAGSHFLHGGQPDPGVIVNMQRGGPGLGDIGPSQGDYFRRSRAAATEITATWFWRRPRRRNAMTSCSALLPWLSSMPIRSWCWAMPSWARSRSRAPRAAEGSLARRGSPGPGR